MDNLSKSLETIKFGQIFSSPQVVILMGLPGSGKSYVADYLHQKYGFTVLSGENISHALFGDNQADFSLVYKTLRQLALQLLSKGHSIVIDGTNLKFSFRQQIYDEVCKNIKPILIYLLVDDQTARVRLDSRLVDASSKQNIKSTCSTETFADFKQQLEEPLAKEFCYRLLSNENLLKEIDNVIKLSNSVYN
ncbi:MAG: ATP-binding protein [Candidatus Shapirobacteria bacterium]